MTRVYAGVESVKREDTGRPVKTEPQPGGNRRQHQIIMLCISQAALDAELRRLEERNA